MTDDTGDNQTVTRGRVLALVGGIVVVIALAVGAMVASGGSDDADAVPGSAADSGASDGSVAEPGSSTPDSDGGTVDSDGSTIAETVPLAPPDEGDSTEPVVGGTDAVEPDVAEISIPALPQDEGSESATCAAIIVKLGQYRDLAESSGMPALAQLRFALEEFDNVTDFLADGHDWGLQIVEQLVLVRRDWSTAHTAYEEGDEQVAEDRFEAAMDYLDAAIVVPCPE